MFPAMVPIPGGATVDAPQIPVVFVAGLAGNVVVIEPIARMVDPPSVVIDIAMLFTVTGWPGASVCPAKMYLVVLWSTVVDISILLGESVRCARPAPGLNAGIVVVKAPTTNTTALYQCNI